MRVPLAIVALSVASVVGCQGTSTITDGNYVDTTSSTTGGGTTGGSGSRASAGASSGSTTGSACKAVNVYVGIGDGAHCCTGLANASGFCLPAPTTSSSGGSSTGVAATGTSTGGTCPNNMPNIEDGTTQVSGTCTETELGSSCPPGFNCVSGECILNGALGGVQVTLSWDDPEDLDLHVREPQAGQPGGYCEIWYGNVGNRENSDGGPGTDSSTGYCTPVGWLDRDSNPGCDLDNVDIENVIYPTNVPPPTGTYSVYVDYYQDCYDFITNNPPEYQQVNYAVQVRANGQLWKYCRSFTPADADYGGMNGGTEVATFTVP